MRRRAVALLAVGGLALGSLLALVDLQSRVSPASPMIESGVTQSFLDMGGSAYVVSGYYEGTTSVEGRPSFALVVELENPVYLGDDSPDNPTQTPAPTSLAAGDVITIRTPEFDAGSVLSKGDRVMVIVAHHSAFDPPWVTLAIARGGADDVTMVGANSASLERELAAASVALGTDRETAFFTIAREQLEADDMVRAGSAFAESLGPALEAVARYVDESREANSLEAAWESADPALRGLQRGVAPDALLDSLPKLYATFSISDEFVRMYPGALIEVRNQLGVTASIDAQLGEGDDVLFGAPGSPFEVTIVLDEDQKAAQVVGTASSEEWSGAYALAIKVFITEDGSPTATTTSLNQEEYATVIESQTRHIARETPEGPSSSSE